MITLTDTASAKVGQLRAAEVAENLALRVAVRPAPSKALYFVARGDGTSVFSQNLADHNRAVNQYQRGR